jgi:translocator protein
VTDAHAPAMADPDGMNTIARSVGRSQRTIRDLVLGVTPLLVGGVTSALTVSSLRDWYPTLAKPSFTPPGALFGPVWTGLYATMGVSAVLVARSADAGADDDRVRLAAAAFGSQLALNAAWSLVFFGARRPGWALVEIVALWLAVAGTVGSFGRVRPVAGVLLVPYLGWVSFATLLNAGIWNLNRR